MVGFFIVRNVPIADTYFAYISRRMKKPILVLQYPDSREARTVALAATRNHKALLAFKQAVLEEAQLRALDWEIDDVLHLQEQLELDRLESLLNMLIPEGRQDKNARD